MPIKMELAEGQLHRGQEKQQMTRIKKGEKSGTGTQKETTLNVARPRPTTDDKRVSDNTGGTDDKRCPDYKREKDYKRA